ncbi:GTPase-associated system all-helical protein GASH [Vallitalea guaymasensis]|uniref:GTPase-associated system all-helical protein GASH n=1 Tax=Vallitalea guaymasensis TaxID=1185412 RepID=UPI000DE52D56|nr:GTPase-associated system all-helical protein GASH [Vallitalea guaymasensis]
MRVDFSEWYSRICLDSESDIIETRWNTLKAYCDKDEHEILELTKLFFELPADESFIKNFVEFYNDDDISFNGNNKREIAVLAGSTLMYLLENNREYLNKILLAIMSLALIHKDVIIPDIIKKIEEKFINISVQLREIEEEQDFEESILENIKANKNLSEELDENTENNYDMFNSIVQQIVNLGDNQIKLYKRLNVHREESKILSWIVGKYSENLQRKLNKKLNQSKAALVIGKELADKVNILPGPYASRAFLSNMLSLCKDDNKKSLIEMVDLLSDDMKIIIVEKYKIIDKGINTPVLMAINDAIKSDKCEVWKHTFNNSFNIQAESIILDNLDWAYQLYLECLLIKCYNGGNSYGC